MAIKVHSSEPDTDPCPRCGEIWGEPPTDWRAALAAAPAGAPLDWDVHYEALHAARYEGLAEGRQRGFAAGIEAATQAARDAKATLATYDKIIKSIRALRPAAQAGASYSDPVMQHISKKMLEDAADEIDHLKARIRSLEPAGAPSEEDVRAAVTGTIAEFNITTQILSQRTGRELSSEITAAVMALLQRGGKK